MVNMNDVKVDDTKVWDDSELQKSWAEARAEYQKYHSIAASGKRLEDVLTPDELAELKDDHGDLIGEPTAAAEEGEEGEEVEEGEMSLDELQPNGTHLDETEEAQQEGNVEVQKAIDQNNASGPQSVQEQSRPGDTSAQSQGASPFAAMGQTLLGTVQDEQMKNLLMSWYYAGYYTGLMEGQRQASSVQNK